MKDLNALENNINSFNNVCSEQHLSKYSKQTKNPNVFYNSRILCSTGQIDLLVEYNYGLKTAKQLAEENNISTGSLYKILNKLDKTKEFQVNWRSNKKIRKAEEQRKSLENIVASINPEDEVTAKKGFLSNISNKIKKSIVFKSGLGLAAGIFLLVQAAALVAPSSANTMNNSNYGIKNSPINALITSKKTAKNKKPKINSNSYLSIVDLLREEKNLGYTWWKNNREDLWIATSRNYDKTSKYFNQDYKKSKNAKYNDYIHKAIANLSKQNILNFIVNSKKDIAEIARLKKENKERKLVEIARLKEKKMKTDFQKFELATFRKNITNLGFLLKRYYFSQRLENDDIINTKRLPIKSAKSIEIRDKKFYYPSILEAANMFIKKGYFKDVKDFGLTIRAISFEEGVNPRKSRGHQYTLDEKKQGMIGIAFTILNRWECDNISSKRHFSHKGKNTLKDIVIKNGLNKRGVRVWQYTVVRDYPRYLNPNKENMFPIYKDNKLKIAVGNMNRNLAEKAYEALFDVLTGRVKDPTHGAQYFQNPELSDRFNKIWIWINEKGLKKTKKINDHIFLKDEKINGGCYGKIMKNLKI